MRAIMGMPVVTLHNQRRDGAEVFRYPGVRQYCLMVERFADVANGSDGDLFSLESSKANQALIDAIYRAGTHDGWDPVSSGS